MRLKDGTVISDKLAIADAHPLGARPFARPQYEEKFRTLAEGIVAPAEQDRFLAAVTNIETLDDLGELNIELSEEVLNQAPNTPQGLL